MSSYFTHDFTNVQAENALSDTIVIGSRNNKGIIVRDIECDWIAWACNCLEDRKRRSGEGYCMKSIILS